MKGTTAQDPLLKVYGWLSVRGEVPNHERRLLCERRSRLPRKMMVPDSSGRMGFPVRYSNDGQESLPAFVDEHYLPVWVYPCGMSLRLSGGTILVASKELAEVVPYQQAMGRPW